MIYTHIQLNTTPMRRSNWRSPGTFESFGYRESQGIRVLSQCPLRTVIKERVLFWFARVPNFVLRAFKRSSSSCYIKRYHQKSLNSYMTEHLGHVNI